MKGMKVIPPLMVDGKATRGVSEAIGDTRERRILKPLMTADTARLVKVHLPFLELHPQTVTPQDFLISLFSKKAIIEGLNASEPNQRRLTFLSLKKTLLVGRMMLKAGLGQITLNDSQLDEIRMTMGKFRPEIIYSPEFGWHGESLAPLKGATPLDEFEAEIIRTIANSFSQFQRGQHQSESGLEAIARAAATKPNGAFYVGICPRCETVFEKRRGDQIYDRELCKKEFTRKKK